MSRSENRPYVSGPANLMTSIASVFATAAGMDEYVLGGSTDWLESSRTPAASAASAASTYSSAAAASSSAASSSSSSSAAASASSLSSTSLACATILQRRAAALDQASDAGAASALFSGFNRALLNPLAGLE